MPKKPSVKETKRVLGAKVEVTKSDAKKVSPLTRFWGGRIHDAQKKAKGAYLNTI